MKMLRQMLPFAGLITILCILAVLKPDKFLTAENLINVLRRCSVDGIIAVGMTFVIISGGIDLSVGSLLAMSGMVGALVMILTGGENPAGISLWIGTAAGVLTGLAGGLANGVLISTLRLPPFIVTLGMMSVYRGISLVMNSGQPYNVPAYTFPGGYVSIAVFAVLTALAFLILRYTRMGRYTYAIGSNRQAAFHAGINVEKNLIAIYSMVGALVGVAAMIATSRTVSAQPTAGISKELDVIAAVVIGGASLSGGRGTITGTIIGTLLISFLRNGCTLVGISTNMQLIVIGVIIVLAVSFDQFAQRRARDLGNE